MNDEIKYKGIILTEDQREFSKVIEGESFTMRIPLPLQKTDIVAATSRAIGGANINSLRAQDFEYVRMLVTLNHVIVKSPAWWQGAESCPNEELLLSLWEWVLSCEKEFQERLKKNVGSPSLGRPQ